MNGLSSPWPSDGFSIRTLRQRLSSFVLSLSKYERTLLPLQSVFFK
ncbi:MAG: hypothetical protein LBD67_00265 [Candidatus Accumulibacter sp.]|nr:hypothetical protein [Accumulibacter sp.]